MLTRARLREKVKPVARRLRSAAQLYRLSILYLLAHEPMIARDIVDYVGLPENLVAHHLKQLHLGGWVVKTKKGREVTYQLREKALFGEKTALQMLQLLLSLQPESD